MAVGFPKNFRFSRVWDLPTARQATFLEAWDAKIMHACSPWMHVDYASIGRAIAMVVSPWGQSQALGWFSDKLTVTPRNHVQSNLKGFPCLECKFDRCSEIPRPVRIFCVDFGGMREQKMRSAADSKLDRF